MSYELPPSNRDRSDWIVLERGKFKVHRLWMTLRLGWFSHVGRRLTAQKEINTVKATNFSKAWPMGRLWHAKTQCFWVRKKVVTMGLYGSEDLIRVRYLALIGSLNYGHTVWNFLLMLLVNPFQYNLTFWNDEISNLPNIRTLLCILKDLSIYFAIMKIILFRTWQITKIL